MNAPACQDRALVRRFKFLGLTGEKRADALSYADLRAELGDANAAALILQLETLVRSHQRAKADEPHHELISRLLQATTRDERRLMALRHSIPPHLEVMVHG